MLLQTRAPFLPILSALVACAQAQPVPAPPGVTAVLDAGSYTPNIVPGSIFAVKGTNLTPVGTLNGSITFSFPLPTSSNGTSIALTPSSANGPAPTIAIAAYLVSFAVSGANNQVAAILPSSVAPGAYNLVVTANQKTNVPFPVTVVAAKPELFTQDTSGGGSAVVQNYISPSQVDLNRFTTGAVNGVTISPAHPGQTLIAWGAGLGAVPTGSDNMPSPGYNLVSAGPLVQVIVGGFSIFATYAGRAPGLAGVDQINFTLPANVPTGCTVPLQVSIGGVYSFSTYISIAPDSASTACVESGFTSAQLQSLDNGGTIPFGGFSILKAIVNSSFGVTVTSDFVNGSFTQFTGSQLAVIPNYATPSNTCAVTPISAAATSTNLDAGTVALNGPSGSGLTNVAYVEDANNGYAASVSETSTTSVTPGIYRIAGAGGKDVGLFNASMTMTSPLSITVPTAISRTAPLTLTWSGGNPSDIVLIQGSTSPPSSGPGIGGNFSCFTTAGQKTFTVPASILSVIPASTVANGGTNSLLQIATAPAPVSGNGLFTAPLTSGGTLNGFFIGRSGTLTFVTYQ